MHRLRTTRVATAALAVAVLGGVAAVVGQAAAAAPRDRVRQGDFADAAKEFHVPQRVLLAVSYAETRWDDHGAHPSTTGAYGPMALVWRPAGAASPRGLAASDTRAQSLATAARLIHARPAELRTDPRENIRGGAALLAYWAKHLGGGLPATDGKWYPAVAKYSGSTTTEALTFADDVYSALRAGASRTTSDGQRMAMRAAAVTPDKSAAKRMRLAAAPSAKAECPTSLHCAFLPAAYAQTDPKDKTKYGNYDRARRPRDLKINSIVIHDTEETYDKTKQLFTDPTSAVSAHYVVRSSDGQITQMVPTRDIAWQAGNWDVNMHSIGIEHEGYVDKGATWFTEPMYRSSARLVRYLAHRFGIPVDRGHIFGHDNVPGQDTKGTASMHTDPGPYWNWDHYLDLVRGHAPHTRPWSAHAKQVAIAPVFDRNKPPVSTCDANGKCTDLPAQGASFVYLRNAPSDDAPLLSDPALHPDGKPGTTAIGDWGAHASSGQRFAVAGRRPGWTGIWYAGTIGWFRDSKAAPATRPAHGRVITPRGATAPTYGVAFPEKAEYPKEIPPVAVTPLPYTLKKGQRYTVVNVVKADYYYAKTIDASLPGDRTVVHGKQAYDVIQLGHRLAYVRTSDVAGG
ncbi:MAG TPA: N-acetylmuramoyl-L-alanine amidase [Streptosporangiaceae bacterium]